MLDVEAQGRPETTQPDTSPQIHPATPPHLFPIPPLPPPFKPHPRIATTHTWRRRRVGQTPIAVADQNRLHQAITAILRRRDANQGGEGGGEGVCLWPRARRHGEGGEGGANRRQTLAAHSKAFLARLTVGSAFAPRSISAKATSSWLSRNAKIVCVRVLRVFLVCVLVC